MQDGTHDGNLITNQFYVGKTLAETSDQVFIRTQFENYLQEPLVPTKATIRVVSETYQQREYEIRGGEEIIIGHRDGGAVRVYPHLENNEIYFTFQTSESTRIIMDLGTIEYLELETQERTYTEFKFS